MLLIIYNIAFHDVTVHVTEFVYNVSKNNIFHYFSIFLLCSRFCVFVLKLNNLFKSFVFHVLATIYPLSIIS